MLMFPASLIAQAVPPDLELTGGQAVAGTLALVMLAFSIGMGITWLMRIQQQGNAIPRASRGVLRCPVTSATIAVVLSSLLGLLALAGSLMPADGPGESAVGAGMDDESQDTRGEAATFAEGAPAAEDAQDGTSESSEPASDAADETAESSESPPIDVRRMYSAFITTLVFDIVVLAGFGCVVWLNRSFERAAVRGPSPATRRSDDATAEFLTGQSAVHSGRSDADAAEETRLEESEESPISRPAVSADVGETGPVEAAETADAAESADHAAAAPEVDSEAEADVASEEPFSFPVELRYAAEVFAVALMPTMLLRVLVVTLYMNAFDTEEIPQHPFLQLMEHSSGAEILLLIAFLAVVMAPLTEELLYRVVILGGMAQAGFVRLGMTASVVLFCLAHGFPDCIALVPLALLLGYTYLQRRSYVTVVMVHFLFNAFNLAVAGIGLI